MESKRNEKKAQHVNTSIDLKYTYIQAQSQR